MRGLQALVLYSNIADVELPPVGGVPEPSTWAMMILGFGAVGGAMRRRRLSGGTRKVSV